MSSKQNIKETITFLCNIINYHRSTKLTPETLRLAKFNKDEATEPMWKLLFQTNSFLNNGSFDACLSAPERKEDIVVHTKHELYLKGYCVKAFFCLPDNMGYGSRDILLAFGWLISESQFLGILVDNCSNLLQECLPINEESSTNPVVSKNSSGHISQNLGFDDLPSLDTLSWLLGNLRLGCNGLYSAESNLVSLVGKVHGATCKANNSKGHFSVLEVFLLRHPKDLAKFQEKLEQYNSYLESLVKFVEHQGVFWKWIKSVYDAKLLESTNNEEKDFSRTSRCVACGEKAIKQREKLSKLNSEIQSLLISGDIFYQKACGLLKMSESCEDRDVKSEELSELNKQMTSLTLDKPSESSRNQIQTFPELRQLEKCHSLTSNTKKPEPSCAKQTISFLKSQLSQLDVELMETKNLHFKILNDLAGNINELVCIPPIESSKYFELKNK